MFKENEKNVEWVNVYLNKKFQGYIERDNYEQLAAAIVVLGRQGDLIITSFLDEQLITTCGFFLDYCDPVIREPLMYELIPLQQEAAVPELKLQTDIESYDDVIDER